MTPLSCDCTRRLCHLVMARGELRIAAIDLQIEIGLIGDVRHTLTLARVLYRAKEWFAERGSIFEWQFIGRDIILWYSVPEGTSRLLKCHQ